MDAMEKAIPSCAQLESREQKILAIKEDSKLNLPGSCGAL
jgi:hypothetical protein